MQRLIPIAAALGLFLLVWHIGRDDRPADIAALGGQLRRDLSTQRVTVYEMPDGMRAQVSRPIPVAAALTASADAAAVVSTGAAACCNGPSCSPAISGGTVAWSNVTNAQGADNGTAATATMGNSAVSNFLVCTNFGFSMDPGSVIAGVYVGVNAWASGASRIRDGTVHLVVDGALAGTSQVNSTWWPSTTQNTIIPHPITSPSTNLWGATLNPTNVSATAFGVALASNRSTSGGNQTGSIDYLSMTIYYYPPKGVIYASGFETFEPELDMGLTGAPVFGAPGIHGNGALVINPASAGTAEAISAPTTFIDADIVTRGWMGFTIVPSGDVLAAVGDQSTIAWWEQVDPTDVPNTMRGCYLLLRRSAQTGYTLGVYYHGNEMADQLYGEVPIAVSTEALQVELAQLPQRTATFLQVNCELRINGQLKVSHYATMNTTSCENFTTACDLKTAWLGTSGSSNGYTDDVLNLRYDSLAVGNDGTMGKLRVEAIFPSANATPSTMGSTGTNHDCNETTNAWSCIDDWALGAPADPVVGSGSGVSLRTRLADYVGIDVFEMSNLTGAQAPTSREAIKSIVYYAVGAEDGAASSDVKIRPLLVSGTPTPNEPVTDTTWSYTARTTPQVLRWVWADDFGRGPTPTPPGVMPTWGPTAVAALKAGYEKTAVTSRPNITAMLLYVPLSQPAVPEDRTLQDWSHDGQLTFCMGCDSIATGTASLVCQGGIVTDGYPECVKPCTTVADCDWAAGGVVECVNPGPLDTVSYRHCSQKCETATDCTCGGASGEHATCQQSSSIAAQTAARLPQVDNLYVLGLDGQGWEWLVDMYPLGIENPYAVYLHRNLGNTGSGLWRGEWGRCTVSGNSCEPVLTPTPETVTGTSPTPTPWSHPECGGGGGDTCRPHGCDYVWNMCGWNDANRRTNPLDCSAGAVAPPRNIYGQRVCPEAATTPGAFQRARSTCTANSDCTTLYGANSGSLCRGYCEGHADPVWPCPEVADSRSHATDYWCNACSNDSGVVCEYANLCANGALGYEHHCNTDADCAFTPTRTATGTLAPTPTPTTGPSQTPSATPTPGVCQAASEVWPSRWHNENNCGAGNTCTFHACKTDVKYCTVPCAALPCTTNTDCVADSTPGGGGWCQRSCTLLTSTPTPIGSATPIPTNTPVGATYTPTVTFTPTPTWFCRSDADCGTGSCDPGVCRACGAGGVIYATGVGGSGDPAQAPAGDWIAMWRQWAALDHVGGSVPPMSPWGMVENHETLRETVEDTYGRRYLGVTYLLQWAWVFARSIAPIEFNERYTEQLRQWAGHIIDLKHLARVYSERNDGSVPTGAAPDMLHLSAVGSQIAAEGTGSALENYYPVCSGDPTIGCGACLVSCSTDTDCRAATPTQPPTTPGTASPTPVNTPTAVANSCSGGSCVCTTNANCGGGSICGNVRPNVGPGTPTPAAVNRCVVNQSQGFCPAGNSVAARQVVAADNVCATRTPGVGLCSQEISAPRCVETPSLRCIDDRDCPRSTQCSVDASYIRCAVNSDCRSNGRWADVCANDVHPTVAGTATPTPTSGGPTHTPTPTLDAKFCRQPTRTP